MTEGKLFVVSGPSGAGKSTVISAVMSGMDNVAFSVSATTREPRSGEEHGREYYFKTKQEFESLIEQGEFLEYAVYVDNYYGTLRSEVDRRLRQGINVILDIEVQGAGQIRENAPEAVMVFFAPPNFLELERRLRDRGKDSEEKIKLRLQTARMELDFAENYDYIVINKDIQVATDELRSIIVAEGCRAKGRLEALKDN